MDNYSVQLRLQGFAKKYAKEVIHDVARKFYVNGVTQKRAVPHISLFGNFKTLNEKEIISEIKSVGRRYELVPFRIKGFDFFDNKKNKVIYLDVEPSEELKNLRRDIYRRLSKYSNNCKKSDMKHDFDFHATVAFKDIDYKFERIWDYIQMKRVPYINQYLLRITILKNSKILCEYDLMQQKLLNRKEALSKEDWKKTITIFKQKTSDFGQDIEDIKKHENIWNKIKRFLNHR